MVVVDICRSRNRATDNSSSSNHRQGNTQVVDMVHLPFSGMEGMAATVKEEEEGLLLQPESTTPGSSNNSSNHHQRSSEVGDTVRLPPQWGGALTVVAADMVRAVAEELLLGLLQVLSTILARPVEGNSSNSSATRGKWEGRRLPRSRASPSRRWQLWTSLSTRCPKAREGTEVARESLDGR